MNPGLPDHWWTLYPLDQWSKVERPKLCRDNTVIFIFSGNMFIFKYMIDLIIYNKCYHHKIIIPLQIILKIALFSKLENFKYIILIKITLQYPIFSELMRIWKIYKKILYIHFKVFSLSFSMLLHKLILVREVLLI